MIVMGIDPGYAIVGYGIIKYDGNRFLPIDYGAITTGPEVDFSMRLLGIFDGLTELMRVYKPEAMAVEKLFFNTNTKTAIGVAEARGCILLSACKSDVPVFEYTPLQVKQSVTGYGKAEKSQVMEMTRILLGFDKVPKPDDTADALAVAICHAHSASSALHQIYTKRTKAGW